MESISQGFVLFDDEDRAGECNEVYRRFFADTADPEVAGILVPGMSVLPSMRGSVGND